MNLNKDIKPKVNYGKLKHDYSVSITGRGASDNESRASS